MVNLCIEKKKDGKFTHVTCIAETNGIFIMGANPDRIQITFMKFFYPNIQIMCEKWKDGR